MALKAGDDPRRCGIKPAPLKTTKVPRVIAARTLRTQDADARRKAER